MTWRDRAACRGLPVDIFYPSGKDGNGKGMQAHHYARAASVCDSCPVSNECLETSLAEEAGRPGRLYQEVQGYRGGKYAHERIEMINERQLARPFAGGGNGKDTIYYWDPVAPVEPPYESPWVNAKQRARARATYANRNRDRQAQGSVA